MKDRSHDGILGLAASILVLLRKHFPYSIDNLPPEKGAVSGPIPIIENKMSDILQFMGSDSHCDEPIEFGASQVIIVRSQENVIELTSKLMEKGDGFTLVLTVEQSKGM